MTRGGVGRAIRSPAHGYLCAAGRGDRNIVSALAIVTNRGRREADRPRSDRESGGLRLLFAGRTEGITGRRSTYVRALGCYSKATSSIRSSPMRCGYARVAWKCWRNNSDQALPAPVARKGAYDAAGKALELDPINARAHTGLALLQLTTGATKKPSPSGNELSG